MRKSTGISILIFVILGLGLFFYNSSQNQKADKLSNDDFVSALTEKFPAFMKENRSVIEVTDIKRFEEVWYVVTIKSLRSSKDDFIPVRLVMLNHDSKLTVVTGPDTHFPESEMLKLNLPDSVIVELQKT